MFINDCLHFKYANKVCRYRLESVPRDMLFLNSTIVTCFVHMASCSLTAKPHLT